MLAKNGTTFVGLLNGSIAGNCLSVRSGDSDAAKGIEERLRKTASRITTDLKNR